MKAIRISKHELSTIACEKKAHGHDKLATPRETERYVLSRLRNAGVPVMGETFLVALERGELSVRREPDGAYLYVWREAA